MRGLLAWAGYWWCRLCGGEGAAVTRTDWLLKQFEDLNVWRRGDERPPHKPLLILYALGQL